MRGVKGAAWGAVLCLLAACSGDEGLTTDLVVNPATAQPGGTADGADGPAITVDGAVHDFGTVARGEQPEHVFVLRNTGSRDLVLADVNAPCGCTVPKDWPREAIPPGGEARIRVQFDSRELTGPFTKDITVLANTIPATTALALTGTVVGPEPATPSTP